jgi:hypothetical protein
MLEAALSAQAVMDSPRNRQAHRTSAKILRFRLIPSFTIILIVSFYHAKSKNARNLLLFPGETVKINLILSKTAADQYFK